MTGPLDVLFAQLGGTLDFLREIENGTRCGQCERPHATDEDWQRYDEGEGEHLCWETVCSHDPESPTALERITEALAALSAIERHVQEMERALRLFVEEYDFHAADYLADRVDGEEARVFTARTVDLLIEHQRIARAALSVPAEDAGEPEPTCDECGGPVNARGECRYGHNWPARAALSVPAEEDA